MSSRVALSHINWLRRRNPRYPIYSPENIWGCRRRPLQTGRVLKLFPAPCRRGESSPEASKSPCLPPEWCVSSPPWDYGSITVARWWVIFIFCLSHSRVKFKWGREPSTPGERGEMTLPVTSYNQLLTASSWALKQRHKKENFEYFKDSTWKIYFEWQGNTTCR